jgi:hypothetical protein
MIFDFTEAFTSYSDGGTKEGGMAEYIACHEVHEKLYKI